MQNYDPVLPKGAIVEMIPSGAYVKVSAADPVTLIEVSIVGDPRAGSKRLKEEAVRKLRRVVEKHRAQNGHAPASGVPRKDPPSGWDL